MPSILDRVIAWANTEDPGVEKASKPYGNVEYADAAEGKYPIDTEEHIRAAWNYVNHPHNAAVLGEKAAAVKAKIEAAWRAKIDPAGPPSVAKIFKATRDEERMVYGFASVSVGKAGEMVEDSHGDLITTKALRSLARGMAKGQRAGKFDHAGVKKTDIVEQLVFDADLWKALGQYFEDTGVLTPDKAEVFKQMTFEGLLQGFHVADDETWALAKDSEFELSIGASSASVRTLD